MVSRSAKPAHYRTCPLCEAMCGLRIAVDAGRVTDLRGDRDAPFSRGHICPKAAALPDLQDDPDRLRHPVRRTAAGWQRVGWDEALDEAAERVHAIQRSHGRDAVAAYVGNPTVHNHGAVLYLPLLLRTLRSRNTFSATSVDQLPHMVAAFLCLGHQLLLPVPDVDRTDLLLVLGANPLVSNGSLMTAPGIRDRLAAIRRRGGRVVVVDPRRTETAREADQHLFIRPGTDALLLLTLMREVLELGPRLRHLEPLVTGIPELEDAARAFTPERTAPHTGIAPDTSRRLARELHGAGSAVCYGRVGASTQQFGALCQWLILALNTVTGNLDRPGGAMFTRPAFDPIAGPRALRAGRGGHARWRSRVRGLPESSGELPVAVLAEEILTPGEGRVRGLITFAGNPVLSTPNGAHLEQALRSLDFMVAVDPYLNETTRLAHLVLPPTGPLERSHYDIVFNTLSVRNTAKYSPALFEPPGDARHDWQILLELAHRLGRLGGRSGLRSAISYRLLRGLGPDGLLALGVRFGPYGPGLNPFAHGLTLGALRRQPHGVDLGELEPCLPARLPPGRSRIDLAPAPLCADLERLRTAFPVSGPREPDGSLSLIGRRTLRDNNSWMHNLPRLMRGRVRCTLMIHPSDASERGLADGDLARVTSRVGSVTVPVEVTDDVLPGVVSLPHGYGHDREGTRLAVASEHAGASLNDLTDDRRVDLLCGTAAFSGVPVVVEVAGPSAHRAEAEP